MGCSQNIDLDHSYEDTSGLFLKVSGTFVEDIQNNVGFF